jgi:hypothetical protein
VVVVVVVVVTPLQALASSVDAERDLAAPAATAEPALPMAKLMPLVNKQVRRGGGQAMKGPPFFSTHPVGACVRVVSARPQVSQLLASDPNPFLATVLHDDQLRQYAFDLFTAFGADE